MYDLCIIGFGISGICCAKWAEKYKLKYIILEKEKDLGGCWFTKALESSTLQSPKNFYQFPDYKMPQDYPTFPNKNQILKYLKEYVRISNIKNINYNYNVLNLEYDNFWKIFVKKKNKQIKIKSRYIAICSGIYGEPNIIDLKNRNNFLGQIIHSKDLNTIKSEELKNKHITLIGNGASCMDILKYISDLSTNINVIYRKNKWYVLDSILGIYTYFYINRITVQMWNKLPHIFFIIFIGYVIKYLFLSPFEIPNKIFDHSNIIMCNKKIYNLVSLNFIKFVKDEPNYLYKNYLVLKTNKLIYSDIIILCTGYSTNISFLKSNINHNNYLHIINPQQNKCGFIGFTPSYNWVQVSYLQSRWFINYILGNIKLPEKKIMEYKINQVLNKKRKLNIPYNDLTYDCFKYCDNIQNELMIYTNKYTLSYWFQNPDYCMN